MQLKKNDQNVIKEIIDQWADQGKISIEQCEVLKKDIEERGSDDKPDIARYFFIIAISCSLIAFAAIFINDKLLERFRQYFALSNWVIFSICTVITILFFWLSIKRKSKLSFSTYEGYMIAGGVSAATALVYCCKEIGFGDAYSGYLFALSIIYLLLSITFRSYVLWIGTLLSLMGWYGALSEAYSNDYLFLGMNYPLRFTVFGIVILGCSLLQNKIKTIQQTSRITYIVGLLIFYTGLWGISVFGNYAHLTEWESVRQVSIVFYALLFAAITLAGLFIGVKRNDDLTRDISLIFLLLNIYTRYFEYFWDATNKGIFFAILGISFWLVGRWIERSIRKKKDKLA